MMAPEHERDPRLDRLYREAGRDAPPAHLDAAILAAAHREAGSRPRPLSAALRRWRVPVSIAALVVVSVSLVTLVQEEGGDELAQVAPGKPMAPAPAPEQAPPAALPSPPPESSRPSTAAPRVRPKAARPAPRGDGDAGAQREPGTTADSARRDAESAASGAGTSAGPTPAAKPLPQPFRVPPRLEEQRAVTPQAAPAAEDRAERAPPAAIRRSAPPAATDAAADKVESREGLARPAVPAVSGRAKSPPWHGFEQEPPQKWLDRIAELRKQGEVEAADEMMAEFRRRFPGHPAQ